MAEARRRTDGRGGRVGGGASPAMADSGTRRRDDGWILLDCLVVVAAGCVDELSRFGNPLAAAAQESRVERLARSAASWSAVCDGAIML